MEAKYLYSGDDMRVESFVNHMTGTFVYVRDNRLYPESRRRGFSAEELEFLGNACGSEHLHDKFGQPYFTVNDELMKLVNSWKDETRDAFNKLWQHSEKLRSEILKG